MGADVLQHSFRNKANDHKHPMSNIIKLPSWSTFLVILFSITFLLFESCLTDGPSVEDAASNNNSTESSANTVPGDAPAVDQLVVAPEINALDSHDQVSSSADDKQLTQQTATQQTEPDTPSNQHQHQQPPLTRNYASNECGSKVIASNSEAEGTHKILDDSMDDYMLSPCKAAEIWFVIELCEPIQPSAFELANFELYSSTFKEVSILGSEKYPTPEWIRLGTFEASDSRELQRFPVVMQQQSTYIKFVKIHLHSFYGSEHFCPVSLVRAFGLSLVEEESFDKEAVHQPPPLPPFVDVTTAAPNVLETTASSAELVDKETTNLENSSPQSPAIVVPSVSATASNKVDEGNGASGHVQHSDASTLLPSVVPIQPPLEESVVSTTTSTSLLPESTIVPSPVEILPLQTPIQPGHPVNGEASQPPTLVVPTSSSNSATTASHKPQLGQVASPASAPAPSGSVIAASPSKETIFLKLNNRIKSLEQNMSFSLATLDDLLRKFRAMEDLIKAKDLSDESTNSQVKHIKSSLDLVTERVYLLVSEKEAFHWQLVQVHIVLMVIEIACIIVLMSRYLGKIGLVVSSVKEEFKSSKVRKNEGEEKKDEKEEDGNELVHPQFNECIDGNENEEGRDEVTTNHASSTSTGVRRQLSMTCTSRMPVSRGTSTLFPLTSPSRAKVVLRNASNTRLLRGTPEKSVIVQSFSPNGSPDAAASTAVIVGNVLKKKKKKKKKKKCKDAASLTDEQVATDDTCFFGGAIDTNYEENENVTPNAGDG